MHRAGAGLSEVDDSSEAILRAVDEAMDQGQLSAPNAAFLFATYPLSEMLGEMAEALTEICGTTSIVGASGAGVFTSNSVVEGKSAVAVLLVESEAVELTPFGVSDIRGREDEAVEEIGGLASETWDSEEDLLLLFPDPMFFNPVLFFPALERQMGAVRAIGGGATNLGGAAQSLHGHTQLSQGLAGGFLTGDFRARVLTMSSMRLVTKIMKVTRSRGNLLAELDGLPALAVYQSLASRLLGQDPFTAAQTLFVALRSAPTSEFFIRNLVGLDPGRQLLALPQPVEAGAELAFCVLEPDESRRRMRDGLNSARGEDPSFALYFNCAGRGQSFYGEVGADIAEIRGAFGALPLTGFYSGAEIAPSSTGNLLHLYTGVLTLFY